MAIGAIAPAPAHTTELLPHSFLRLHSHTHLHPPACTRTPDPGRLNPNPGSDNVTTWSHPLPLRASGRPTHSRSNSDIRFPAAVVTHPLVVLVTHEWWHTSSSCQPELRTNASVQRFLLPRVVPWGPRPAAWPRSTLPRVPTHATLIRGRPARAHCVSLPLESSLRDLALQCGRMPHTPSAYP